MMAASAEVPARFEQRSESQFVLKGNGYAARLSPAGMTLATRDSSVDLRWRNARASKLTGAGERSTVTYFRANDRASYPTHSRVTAANLYNGIDLVYYGANRRMEYDFIVHPGADPAAIQFTAPARITGNGELVFANGLRFRAPIATQQDRKIPVRFVERDGSFGFDVGPFDHTRELVIDPVLTYSTYLGGSLADEARGIAADAQGNAYIVGSSVSIDFPGAARSQTFGSQDVFVAKLNPSGRGVVWTAYIGGNGVDTGLAIAVDSAGAAYVAGQSASNNFPVSADAPQKLLAGGSGITDAFIVKLAPSGTAITYASYFGGASNESANAIAIDSTGAAYIAGRTDSTDFPATTKDTLPVRGGGDAFVVKFARDGASVVYASILGGFAVDIANSIAVDSAGSAHIAGETRSDNFPITETAYQKTRRGTSDAFVSKLAANGASLVFSTYYGGDLQEVARAIGVDARGNVYIAGQTTSPNLPVSFNSVQSVAALLPDAFVARFDPLGTVLVYGTFLGGSADEIANALAVDSLGNAYVGGQTFSSNFPLRNDGPIRSEEFRGGADAFLARISAGGNQLQFSTHLGGAGTDSIQAVAIDGRGRTWVTGVTDSANLLTTEGALATRPIGAGDSFAALYSEILVTIAPAFVTLGPRESQQFTTTISNTANTAIRWSIFPDIGTITQTGLYTAPDSFAGSPGITVSAISVADGTKIADAVVTLVNRLTITMTPLSATLAANQTQQFNATVLGAANTTVRWTLTPNVGSITPGGLYTAPATILSASTVTLRASAAADNTKFVEATINLVPPLAPPRPEFTLAGVTNAASFRPARNEGGIAPGELITIFGQNMGSTPTTLQLDGRGFVSTRLAGTRVLFDGTPGAMIVSSTQQISVVVPYDVEGKRAVPVQVEFEGRLSDPIEIPVAASAPGIFTQNSSGSGAGAVIRPNGELVRAGSGAVIGETLILFATGEGATDPAGVDGKPTVAPLPRPKTPVTVLIDGQEVRPVHAGGAPGLVAGVLQVNFVVPLLSNGDKRLQLRIGNQISPESVTINIR